ncbi:hypothetical protein SARC_00889 [Sphaeroforma arctica JP610]|uniref:Uncharacterized protein n=1 Tax=Sphaeroforma arctica JP610 TaxID=667725 RepID=A0A0L0GDM9_9EUKA|nr:hypothetical protein SARC_00889 [Sphaeroforma arctica JP610]KNC86996.1 hypothetical protein SARC_00889 [Sphaeroforma arctica JP610]|eukprot:XP_014160898.1 hypothetical protein SARC_00889 [Sphaeroforma arctica JP610]
MRVHVLAGAALCLLARDCSASTDATTEYYKMRNSIHSQCARMDPTNSSIYTGGCADPDMLYFHYNVTSRMFSTYNNLCLSVQNEVDIVLWNADGDGTEANATSTSTTVSSGSQGNQATSNAETSAQTSTNIITSTDTSATSSADASELGSDYQSLLNSFSRAVASRQSEDSAIAMATVTATETNTTAEAAQTSQDGDGLVSGQESQLMAFECNSTDTKQKFGVSEGIFGQLLSDYYQLCADVEHQHYNARVILWTCKDINNYKAPNQQWYSYGYERNVTELNETYYERDQGVNVLWPEVSAG